MPKRRKLESDSKHRFILRQPTVAPTPRLADRIIKFIEQLPVHHGRHRVGKPVQMFDYQKEIIRGMFPDDRSVRHAVVSLPRKQAKSQIAVWLIICHLLMRELQQPSSQILAISVAAKQAKLLFYSVADIIDRLSLKDSSQCSIVTGEGKERISVPDKGIRFQVLASDTSGARLQGYSPDFVVLDEAASFTSVLPYQSATQANPRMVLLISTQCHLHESEIHYFTKLLQEKDLPKHHYRYFRGATREEAAKHFDDPKVWAKVTPAPEIKSMDYIREQCEEAKKFDTINSFRCFQLNALVPTLSSQLSIATDEEISHTWQPTTKIKAGEQVVLGLDIAVVHDLCALVLLTPDGQTDAYFFVPQQAVLEAPNVPYQRWHDEGYLQIVNDRCVSFVDVANKVLEFQKKYQLIAVCKDTYLSNHYLIVAEEAGVTTEHQNVRQMGKEMNIATKQLQAFLKMRRLKINNPCLMWSVNCTNYSQDTHGNIRPHKQLSMSRAKGHRIDGTMALANACYYVSENKLTSTLSGFFIGDI